MKIKPVSKFLIAVIIASIIISLFQIGIRISAEKKENTVDIAADYYTFKTFANAYGKTAYDAINELSKNGIVSVAVPEQCIQDVIDNGEVSQYGGGDILSGTLPQSISDNINFQNYPIKPFYTVLITKNSELAERMEENLPDGTKLIRGKNDTYAVIVHSDPTDEVNLGIGFDENIIEKFRNIGLNIVLRPRYTPGKSDLQYLEGIINKYDIHSVMFYGNAICGDGGAETKALANFFRKNNVVTYIIELPIQKGIYSQEGLPQLIKETGYYVTRVYSIYPAEQLKLTPPEIFNRWFRSISDRNIRVIYIKPIIDTGKTYQENMYVNDYYANKLHTLWKEKGMLFGVPKPMPEVNIHISIIFFISLGIIALFTIYMYILFDIDERSTIILFIILSLLGAMLIFFSKNITEKIAALSATVTVTGMISLFIFEYVKKLYQRGKVTLIKTIKHGLLLSIILFGFSLIGAIWIGALLSPSPYLLNLDMFRGVKILYLSPFIFLIANYLYVFGANFNNKETPKDKYNLITETKHAWNITVKWGHIIILIMLAGVLLVYILRSGNTGVSISSLELKFRAFLEHHIVARPRFKEFLIGYPGVFFTILAAYLMRKKWVIIFSAFAAMGSVSIVDTFSHLRETFLVSLYRSLWGIGIGIIASILIILVIYLPVKNEK